MSSDSQSLSPKEAHRQEIGLADDSSATPSQGSGRRNQLLTWIALLVFAALLIGMRVRYYDWPPDHDVALYAVIGHEMLQGRQLYTELFDIKPPALYMSFALTELLFGYGTSQIFWGNLICGLLILVGVYRAAVNAGMSRVAGLWSACFWALLASDLLLQCIDLNAESFINVLMVWVFVLWLGKPAQNFGWGRVVSIAVLVALMSLYKHNSVAIAGALSVSHLLMPPSGISRKKALAHVGVIFATGVAAWAITLGYFAALGRFDDAYFALFTYSRAHVGSLTENLWRGIWPPGLYQDIKKFFVLIPLLVLTALGIIAGIGSNKKRCWVMLAALLAGSHLALFLPGNLFNHYYRPFFSCDL